MKCVGFCLFLPLLTICSLDCAMVPAADKSDTDKPFQNIERGKNEATFSVSPYLNVRQGLKNSRTRFLQEKQGRVAFLGGSITEMEGYRPMVCEILKRRFPETQFEFMNAGIASTCSTTGAFRMQRDVLSKGPVDLFLVEFAVNDQQDANHTESECIRGMEGILRQALQQNPNMDVVFLYFVNPFMMDRFRQGETPLVIQSHEKVAQHYGIPSLDLAREVTDRIDAGEFDWEKFGGVHPAPFGNAIYAHAVERLMEACWKGEPAADAAVTPYNLPKESLDKWNYGDGIFVGPEKAQADAGWTLGTPDWKSLKGECRERFARESLLYSTQPGAEAKLVFSGTAVGLYVLAGPDAGIVAWSVDGAPVQTSNLYHEYSAGLHYPRTCMLATELTPGRHELTLRVAEQQDARSAGHAVRILQFPVNGKGE